MEKKIFAGIFSLLVFSFTAWYIFVDYANEAELKKVDQELKIIGAKLNSARHAKLDYSNIQKKYEKDQKRLVKERTRFVGKSELSDVTRKLQKFAGDFDLKLMDFSPALEAYFAADPGDKIVSLPIEIAVNGNYLSMGKFLENWYQLPFYLIPEEIHIERVEPEANKLVTTITASLYTWNE